MLILQGHPGKEGPPGEKGALVGVFKKELSHLGNMFICMCVCAAVERKCLSVLKMLI